MHHILKFKLSLLIILALISQAVIADDENITISLVTDFETRTLISAKESITPVTQTVYENNQNKVKTIGSRSELWIRNAHIDYTFFFEKYYEGKYIGRESSLIIPRKDLAIGEHKIYPGGHIFNLAEDGKLSSPDPEILIEGNIVMLKCHKITIYGVDAVKTGPPQFRNIASQILLFTTEPGLTIDSNNLPDAKKIEGTLQSNIDSKIKEGLIYNAISDNEDFYPLSIWLPSNSKNKGYLTLPSWQTFIVTPEGKVELNIKDTSQVPEVTALNSELIIPYRKMRGRINSISSLSAVVGPNSLDVRDKKGGEKELLFSATIEPIVFKAGYGNQKDQELELIVDQDLSKRPNKYFLADNLTENIDAIRLVLGEWDSPIFESGTTGNISVRLKQSRENISIKEPTVQMSISEYHQSNPAGRYWKPIEVLSWSDNIVKFKVPQSNYGFYILRVQVTDKLNVEPKPSLSFEIESAIIPAKQIGSASFNANKGRNAFVCGEDMRLRLILRTPGKRQPSDLQVVLTLPSGDKRKLTVRDEGQPWQEINLKIPASVTDDMSAGYYTLGVENLPSGMSSYPFHFDMVTQDRSSEYLVVKTSKYTKAMTKLLTSHWNGKYTPINIDRAVKTISELGYNRIDNMQYTADHHVRPNNWREALAQSDPRLPSPSAVYTPSPRDQMLNACVREQIEFSDVLVYYHDFHLPRYIDAYILAGERWLAREIQSMRHSPAMDGMMLYDEMYDWASDGLGENQQKIWLNIREEKATETLGITPAKIETGINRYIVRPESQRDPKALQDFLSWRKWSVFGWGDWTSRMVKVGKSLAPESRYGTYHRTFMGAGNSDFIQNGYAPDIFKDLDIISHVHYADNSTSWVNVPMLAQLLRTGKNKSLYVNLPVSHESRTKWDGQYQRQMAFALMAQGANGIAMWGLPADFEDAANEGTLIGMETTRLLNKNILQIFGPIVDNTKDGYRKVGIMSTLNQHILSPYKEHKVSGQTELLWGALWRMGYAPVFIREETLDQDLSNFEIIFAPGVFFDGEISEKHLNSLKQAINNGTKVIVETESALSIPGVIQLKDYAFDGYGLGTYFATWHDDELNKFYMLTENAVNYLKPKMEEWNIEPAATGPFKVGPNWRESDDIHYLFMANFDDPDYGHTVKQQMAKPVLIPMSVPARHGNVAYDLLRDTMLELKNTTSKNGKPEKSFNMDMLRIQGGIVAFLPEPIKNLKLSYALNQKKTHLRLEGNLHGDNPITGNFPVTIEIDGKLYYRVLGKNPVELKIPDSGKDINCSVRENISGRKISFIIKSSSVPEQVLVLDNTAVFIPYPNEVRSFLKSTKKVQIIYSDLTGFKPFAEALATQLKAKGIECELEEENNAVRFPHPDMNAFDPYGDGFHSWQGKRPGIYQPAMVADDASILLAGATGSYVFDAICNSGFITQLPDGQLGQHTQPMIQVANRALNPSRSTLCLIANDEIGMQTILENLFNIPADTIETEAALNFQKANELNSDKTSIEPAAISFMGNNEYILDAKNDKNGNIYLITWGHGDNIYSYTSNGEFRFSYYLPEMGADDLRVFDDRILVYTAAGAKLYRLDLNGKPVNQVQLNMDRGSLGYRDTPSLSHVNYKYFPKQKKLVHIEKEDARVYDDEFNELAHWKGKEYFDEDVSNNTLYRKLLSFAFSPDGSRIAQIESSKYYFMLNKKVTAAYDAHIVIRNLKGDILYEYEDTVDNGIEIEAAVSWDENMPGPIVKNSKLEFHFDDNLNLLSESFPLPSNSIKLDFDHKLERDGHSFFQIDDMEKIIQKIGPFKVIPTIFKLADDRQTIACLDETGLLTIWADSKKLSSIEVAERGKVLLFSADSKTLYIGSFRGTITAYDLTGNELWTRNLAERNMSVLKPLVFSDPAFADMTDKIWSKQHDYAGELDALVRMGKNRWPEDIKRSFTVGTEMVGAELTRYLGTHSTWVLEFEYKAVGTNSVALTAGIRTESQYPDSVAQTFTATQKWQFGRIVIKNGRKCESLKAGFSATSGEVSINQVQFRQIRFPSVNHMLYEPLYDLEPIILDLPYYITKYDAVGNLREDAPNQVLISKTINGSPNLAEPAYLQNGRINDMGKNWYVQPRITPEFVTMNLKDQQWISTVALYFNAYDSNNPTPHFDVYVTDLEQKKEIRVASIRNNTQTFRLIKFKPIRTTNVKIHMVNSFQRIRTLTEIELYGPLSGKEGAPGFTEKEGNNAYMGDFSRVDKRKKTLAKEFGTIFERRGTHDSSRGWYAPLSTPLIDQNRLVVGSTFGASTAYDLTIDEKMLNPGKELYWSLGASIGYVPEAALYGGLVLRAGVDGKLYCISADTGATLWSTKLGERLMSSPVVIGEDIFVANETGKLFQIDMANGSIMKETTIGSGVFGHLATDDIYIFMITDNGELIAIDKNTMDKKWSTKVAPFTDSTPAVDNNVVYLGDQKGVVYAVNAKNGTTIWKTDLNDEFTRCPVVTDTNIVLGCRGGTLAVLDRDTGAIIWKKEVNSRFNYEPMVFEDELLYFENTTEEVNNNSKTVATAKLALLEDGTEKNLKWYGKIRPWDRREEEAEHDFVLSNPPVTSLGYYKGRIFVFPRHDGNRTIFKMNVQWHITHGSWVMLIPEDQLPKPEQKK